MSDNQPTEPLPPAQPQGVPPQQPPAQSYRPPAPQQAGPAPVAEPFYKRHGLAFAISTLVLAVILLFGAIGVGAFAVSSVVFHGGSPLSRLLHEGGQGRQAPAQPKNPGNGGGQNGGGHGGGGQNQGPTAKGVVRGSVTKIDGSTWTLQTQRGVTLTVDTTSSTAYGAPGSSQKASDFATGDNVIVLGTRSGDTVQAIRILKLSDLPVRPPSLPGSTATPGS